MVEKEVRCYAHTLIYLAASAGFALAAQWAGVDTIAFAEIDPYASRVLKRRWPNVRNYGRVQDVPTIDNVWLVTGGVPCQPASVAGKRLGTADDRWLWPEALAAVERIKPEWVLFENPTGILSLNDGVEFERICLALESQGYEVQPIVIPDCAVGLPTLERHLWIIASNHGIGFQRNANTSVQGQTVSERRRGSHDTSLAELPRRWNPDQSRLLRGRKGFPNYVDRVRCLGNAVSPPTVYQLIKRMIEAEASR